MVVKYTDNVGEGGFNKDMESRSRLVEIVLHSRVYKVIPFFLFCSEEEQHLRGKRGKNGKVERYS